jgi:hypothetical protein
VALTVAGANVSLGLNLVPGTDRACLVRAFFATAFEDTLAEVFALGMFFLGLGQAAAFFWSRGMESYDADRRRAELCVLKLATCAFM